VREKLTQVHPSIEVVFGMRYGSPSLEKGLDELRARGCARILLFPMYPQYAAATTGSTYDAVFKHLLKERWVPTLRVAEPYYRHPLYVKSLATTINDFYRQASVRPERLVLSYHGIPEKYVTKGDPYCCQCNETTEALYPWLQVPREEVVYTYQSRFGKDPWLRPYTDKTVEMLGDQGIKHLAVACPGFTADCLETLDEVGNEALEQFHEHGGETLKLIPCLNDAPIWIDAMSRIIQEEISSWVTNARRDIAAGCCGTLSCPVSAAREEEARAATPSS
jgi:ferrochelatase